MRQCLSRVGVGLQASQGTVGGDAERGETVENRSVACNRTNDWIGEFHGVKRRGSRELEYR